MKHFISIAATSTPDLQEILQVAFRLRAERLAGKANEPVLSRKTLAMIFEKPSLRTRVSFEQAMIELGGHAIVMSNAEVGLGKRELAADVGRVLSGMVQGIMARVFEHQKLLDLVEYSTVPVINALSELSHPCQALADVMTMMDEFGQDLSGRTMAFIGDGNNVARSLAAICGRLNMKFVLACPKGYELYQPFIERLMKQSPGMDFRMTYDAVDAVKNADAVYTDTWISMGQEAEAEQRRAAFSEHQVNVKLMGKAPAHAIVLHCLPAYRGYEITAEVLDSKQSRIFPQAHNRLHAQKGLLAVLMGGARGRRP